MDNFLKFHQIVQEYCVAQRERSPVKMLYFTDSRLHVEIPRGQSLLPKRLSAIVLSAVLGNAAYAPSADQSGPPEIIDHTNIINANGPNSNNVSNNPIMVIINAVTNDSVASGNVNSSITQRNFPREWRVKVEAHDMGSCDGVAYTTLRREIANTIYRGQAAGSNIISVTPTSFTLRQYYQSSQDRKGRELETEALNFLLNPPPRKPYNQSAVTTGTGGNVAGGTANVSVVFHGVPNQLTDVVYYCTPKPQ